jgi:hypothetical protein
MYRQFDEEYQKITETHQTEARVACKAKYSALLTQLKKE